MNAMIIVAAIASTVAQSSTAGVAAPLRPSGPWNVEYAERLCILSRPFKRGDETVLLVIRPAMFSSQVRVLIMEPAGSGKAAFGKAQMTMDGAGAVEERYVQAFSNQISMLVTAIDTESDKLEPMRADKPLRILAGKTDVTVAPTSFAKAMDALDTCQRDLLVEWGMARELVDAIASFPKIDGGLISLFRVDDYPSESIRESQQGTSEVRFWVGTDGRPKDCTIVNSSGHRKLDVRTCAIIEQRGKFKPAVRKDGAVIEAISFARVRWELP